MRRWSDSNDQQRSDRIIGAIVAIGLVVALIAIMLQIPESKADDPDPMQARTIMVMAYGLSHIPLPDKAPVIRMVSREKLQATACPGRQCDARGWTDDAGIMLLAGEDYQQPGPAGILLHEMVHWLQLQAYGPATDCPMWKDREAQAFSVQQHALEKAGEHAAARDVARAARAIDAMQCG